MQKISNNNINFRIPTNVNIKLKPGQHVMGKVLGFMDGKPIIKFGNSPPLKTHSPFPLKIGQTVFAKVENIENGIIFMKILDNLKKSISKDQITQFIKKSHLSKTDINIAKFAIKNSIPANKELLSKIINLSDNINENIFKLSALALKLGMNLTKENLFILNLIKNNPLSINFFSTILGINRKNLLKLFTIKEEPTKDDIKTIFKSLALRLNTKNPHLEAISSKLFLHSDSNFFFINIPLFLTSDNDVIEFLFKKKKKNNNKKNNIFNYMLSFNLKKLGKTIFHVWQNEKRISMKVYTDNYLSSTLLTMFIPKLKDRLNALGYNVIKNEQFFKENLNNPRERAFSPIKISEVDFTV